MQPSNTTKNIWSKMLSAVLSIVLMAGFVSPTALAFAAEEENASSQTSETHKGTCGTGVTWTLDNAGNLVISGTGELDDLSEVTGSLSESVKSITIDTGVVAKENCSMLFCGLNSAVSIDVSKLDTSRVKNMHGLFYDCSSLVSLNLGSFNTSNVTDMSSMFYQCKSLKTLNTSSFDTSKVTNMHMIFCGCESLSSIDISGFDTSDVTDMGSMFGGCTSLNSVTYPKNFDTSKVSNFAYMFGDCSAFKTLDLSMFDTSSAVYLNQMFYCCSALESLNVSSFNTSKVEYMGHLFEGCKSLESLDLSSFDMSKAYEAADTEKYARLRGMFDGCNVLKKIIVSDKGNITGLLPTPDAQYIKDATGKWVNSEGKTFSSAEIPAYVAATYTAEITGSSNNDDNTDILVSISGADSAYAGSALYIDAASVENLENLAGTDGLQFVVEEKSNLAEAAKAAVLSLETNVRKVADVLDIRLTDAEGNEVAINAEDGIEMKIRIAMTEAMKALKADTIRVCYVSDEGTLILSMPTTIEDNRITFTTTHLSTYVVTGEAQSDESGDDPIDNTPTVDDQTGTPAGDSTQAATTQDMYRLYNPNSGEHFYTASDYERGYVEGSGWIYEGIAWTAPVKSNTPVYRLYSGTDHHYTTSVDEKNMLVKVGWKDEGIGWYSDDAKGVPLYRQFNPNVDPSAPTNYSGSHNYTTSKVENNSLVIRGWRQEGIGWYGVISSSTSATDLGLDTLQSLMLKEVNAQRAANGSPALELDARINATAQVKAKDMCDSGLFSHNSAKLGYFSDQLKEAGISYISGGENIAYNQTTVDQVMDAWMNSEGHRANILDPDFTHLGVGYYNGYWVQQFIQE